MSEALKILNNIRTLRAQARECTLETLEEMLEKLEVVVNERREEESQSQAEIEERARKLQQYREMLIADGIDPMNCYKLQLLLKLLVKQNVLHVLLNISIKMRMAN